MSTRCHIIVKGSKDEPIDGWAYIYHHHDGSPDGVGKELLERFRECITKNAYGHKYTWGDIVEFIVSMDDGYEIDYNLHGDEEYIYVATLDDNKEGVRLDCYGVPSFGFAKDTDFFCKENGYEHIFSEYIHNSEPGLLTDKNQKKYMDEFKSEICKLHNVELLKMMKLVCDELTLRETE